MKAALDRVKRALTTSHLAPHLAFVHVEDGWMSASDGRIYACAPVDTDLTFLVAGRELEKAIDIHPDVKFSMEDDVLTIKHGRTRVKLRTLDPLTFYKVEEPRSWRAFPSDMLDVLKRVRPFISENANSSACTPFW